LNVKRADAAMDVTVLVSSGRVRGTRRDGVIAFLGIPYAADAVGPARFQAPRPAPTWDRVRDAVAFGPTALQAPYPPPMDQLLPSSVVDGPSYLNVNVWTPDPGAGGLPVMVWIHGGAFVRGANSIPVYDGSAFARDGVVLISINYRLGIAGFPVLPDAPTNLGLRDQLLALAWVQENAVAFGGDPSNVTVFGESAGGMSIATLMATPAARGLFARAVVQSGSGRAVGAMDDLRRVTEAVAEHLGVAPTAAALGAVDPDALRVAQSAVGLQLATNPDPGRWGATTVRAGLGIMAFFPCIDGDLVTGVPSEVIASGGGAGTPLLAGTTTEEFRLFSVPTGLAASITEEALPVVLGRYGWPSSTAQLYALNRPDASPGDVVSAMLTDVAFRLPTVELAEAQAATGAPAHLYEFAWRTPVSNLRACHALELAFVFDTLRAPGGMESLVGKDAPGALAKEMHSAWLSFARDGDPGWPAYTPQHRAVLVFDVASNVVLDPRADEVACWPPADPGRAGQFSQGGVSSIFE
jgi:para-nitrobenzyl esterase